MSKKGESEVLTGSSRTIAEISIDSTMLYERLEDAAPGELIPYSELTDIIKRDVQGSGRGNLHTARNMALHEKGMVFDAVRNEGVRRLKNDELHAVGARAAKHIRRATHRTIRKLSTADIGQLSRADAAKLNAQIAFHGAMAVATQPAKIKEIEKHCADGTMPTAETLALLTG